MIRKTLTLAAALCAALTACGGGAAAPSLPASPAGTIVSQTAGPPGSKTPSSVTRRYFYGTGNGNTCQTGNSCVFTVIHLDPIASGWPSCYSPYADFPIPPEGLPYFSVVSNPPLLLTWTLTARNDTGSPETMSGTAKVYCDGDWAN